MKKKPDIVASLAKASKRSGKRSTISVRKAIWEAHKADDILEGRTSVGRSLSREEIEAFMKKRATSS